MIVTRVFSSFLFLLVLQVPKAQATETSNSKDYADLISKRRFLTPRDLNGSYSRFLEVSEDSTLCPNTVTHKTNGVLYPNGNIHIPLKDITQDDQACSGPGDLIIRFRRRMNSQEIQDQFNITKHATGIDKMVRDVLLALDGFYFGRQNAARNCHLSNLPPKAAFFFTSQDRPFATNVGVPFRRNPKIMFIVDEDRVCGFSGYFFSPKAVAMEKHPTAASLKTPNPRSTPFSTKPAKSALRPTESKAPRQPKKETTAQKEQHPPEPNGKEQKKQPYKPLVPRQSLDTPVPTMEYKETPVPSQHNESKQHMKDYMNSSKPLPIARPTPMDHDRKSTAGSHHDKIGNEKKHSDQDNRPRPSLGHFPEDASSDPSASSSITKDYQASVSPSAPPRPSKNERPLTSPPSSPAKSPYSTENPSSSLSSSPAKQKYYIVLPSASQSRSAQPSYSMKPPRSHHYNITAVEGSPSPSPLDVSNAESNHSNTHPHGEIHHMSTIVSPTVSPELSPWEVIIADSGSTCFPSSATVMLRDGRKMRMDELSPGISVSVGHGKSSRVIDFSHSDRTVVSSFLHVVTKSGSNLTVTPPHFVYTDRGLVPAARVIPGDYLKLSNGRHTRVLSITHTELRGLFNPHTLHGDIVVDGFIVSTYTLAAAPLTAHALLAPIRFLFDLGIRASIVSKMAQQESFVRAFRAIPSIDVFTA